MKRSMQPVCLILPILLLLPLAVDGAELENEYFRIEIDESSGRFFLAAMERQSGGGRAGDGGADGEVGKLQRGLLFYDEPPSSFAVLNDGGRLYVLGGTGGIFQGVTQGDEKRIGAEWATPSVRVTLDVSFVKRRKTGIEDGVLLLYRARNLSEETRSVGFSVVLDTYLGEGGKYHFILPDGRMISSPAVYSGEDVSDYWISSAPESREPHCVRGVVGGSLVTRPDRLIFANYRFLAEHPGMPGDVNGAKRFDYGPYSRNDSAVSLCFDPDPLHPGEAREYRTILGLCGQGEYGEDARKADPSAPGYPPPGEQFPERVPGPPLAAAGPSPVEPSIEPIPPESRDEAQATADEVDDIDRIDSLIRELNQYLEKDTQAVSEKEIRRLEGDLKEVTSDAAE